MSLDERLSDLIRNIYCAEHCSRTWDTINAEILRQTGACAGLGTVVDLESGKMKDFRFFGRESSGVADAMAEYPSMTETDPSLQWAIRNPAAGFCASDRTLPAENYLSNKWIKWNKSRMGATHWYVCYSPPGSRFSHSLSLHIPHTQGAATADQIRKFRMLFGHLESSAWLHRAPRDEDDEGIWLVLDRDARVAMKSRAAEALLSAQDGLTLREGRLAACDSQSQTSLDKCLARTAKSCDTGASSAVLWVERANSHPWLITVRPVTTAFAGLARVISGFHVQITRPHPNVQRVSSFTSLFGLSPRESEVLELLACGHSLASLSEVLCISANTAKVHLQAIFAKTRTRRQAELLQLCARIEPRSELS